MRNYYYKGKPFILKILKEREKVYKIKVDEIIVEDDTLQINTDKQTIVKIETLIK